jgi:hypothetical protein
MAKINARYGAGYHAQMAALRERIAAQMAAARKAK